LDLNAEPSKDSDDCTSTLTNHALEIRLVVSSFRALKDLGALHTIVVQGGISSSQRNTEVQGSYAPLHTTSIGSIIVPISSRTPNHNMAQTWSLERNRIKTHVERNTTDDNLALSLFAATTRGNAMTKTTPHYQNTG